MFRLRNNDLLAGLTVMAEPRRQPPVKDGSGLKRSLVDMATGGTGSAEESGGTHGLRPEEIDQLQKLRMFRRWRRRSDPLKAGELTLGESVADKVAAGMGSWRFIIIQSTILLIWVALNVTAFMRHWDLYPFILLNLALFVQAAYAAPFIQNRQQNIDRKEAANDYSVNIKAELEIELLHQKIDQLLEKEVLTLTQAVEKLTALLSKFEDDRRSRIP
jgi:uncharacterized membrane protein